MNELLQKHGCANVFTVPEGLTALMSDITREVLREQPVKVHDFIANYLSAMLVTREHGILAVTILEDLCDCKPTISEHLLKIGLDQEQSETVAKIIQQEISVFESTEEMQQLKEIGIMKKISCKYALNEEEAAKICQVIRNSYKEYWYRKKVLEQQLKLEPNEPWEIAVQNTLNIYKKTKPTFGELTLATTRIQAAYRSYYTRKNMLQHLKPNKPEIRPFPPDEVISREVDLGPVINIGINEDDVGAIFDAELVRQGEFNHDSSERFTYEDTQGTPRPTTDLESRDTETKIDANEAESGSLIKVPELLPESSGVEFTDTDANLIAIGGHGSVSVEPSSSGNAHIDIDGRKKSKKPGSFSLSAESDLLDEEDSSSMKFVIHVPRKVKDQWDEQFHKTRISDVEEETD